MAWTTSACLRARPPVADDSVLDAIGRLVAAAGLPGPRTLTPSHVAFLLIALAALAPLLPDIAIVSILLMSGVSLAVYGAEEPLAAATRSEKSSHPDGGKSATPHEPAPSPPARQDKATVPAPDWADLIARINHELRTPLNAVIGFSEVMALEMFGPLGNDRYQDYVRHIRDSAGDLLKSAEDTLALTALLSTPHAMAPAACELEQAIVEAWEALGRKSAASEVALEITLPEGVEVMADPRALRQALVNVFSEGLARAAAGGQVSVMALADGELVEIVVCTQAARHRERGSLAITLARTLLEVQGTSLIEMQTSDGAWRAVTILDRAAQPDFFAADAVRLGEMAF